MKKKTFIGLTVSALALSLVAATLITAYVGQRYKPENESL